MMQPPISVMQAAVLALALVLAANAVPIRANPPGDAECDVVPSPVSGYTKTRDYVNIAGQHPNHWNLHATHGVLTGRYPDYISFNGSQSSKIDGYADINVNSRTNTGVLVASVFGYAHISSKIQGEGQWTILSNSFGGYPDLSVTVPFMQGGVAEDIIVHGCSKQGEPFFQRTNCYLCTWGKGNIYFNGELVYEDVYTHTMFTDRTRDADTMAMYANADRTKIYSPNRCSEGWVDTRRRELHVIAGKYCRDPAAFPPVEAVLELVFDSVEDRSEHVLPAHASTLFFPVAVQPQSRVVLDACFGAADGMEIAHPAFSTPFNSTNFGDLHALMRAWREVHGLAVEMDNLVLSDDGSFAFVEGHARSAALDVPIAALAALDEHEKMTKLRLYFSEGLVSGQPHVRGPFPRSGPQVVPAFLARYHNAVVARDVNATVGAFSPHGCFHDGTGQSWCGVAALTDFYTGLLARDSTFEWVTSIVGNSYVSRHRTVAVEFNVVFMDKTPVQSGLAIYEEDESGYIISVRTYDDLAGHHRG